jgi:hypothetical protein
MAGYGYLPQFQAQNQLLDFSGLNAGIDAVGKKWKDDKKKDAYNNALMQAGDVVDPRLMALAQGMEPDAGTNALFGAYGQAENRKLTAQQRDLQERQFERQSRQTDQQIRLQQQTEARNAATMKYDIELKRIQADTARSDNALMQGLMGGGAAPQASAMPPQAQPPMQQRSPLPGPAMPQGGDGFDPAMVRPMADTGAQPAPIVPQAAPAQPDLIKTPYGEMPKERAERLAGYLALKGKKEAAHMITEALKEGALGKPAQNKFEEKAFNASELSSRLDDIASKYDDKFQTYETSFKMGAVKLADSFEVTRGRIRPEDRAQFQEYSQFRRAAVDNLSQYIKEITGAAMGVQEEKRIRVGIPDPEKDSPAEFRAKLNDTMRSTKAALARYNYLIAQKYDAKALMANKDQIERMIKIEDMPKIINERGAVLKQQILSTNPQADPGQVTQAVAARIKQEFGI